MTVRQGSDATGSIWPLKVPKPRVFLIALLMMLAPAARAAPGDLDPAFGVDGKVVTTVGASHSMGGKIAVQFDGRIVQVGQSHNGTDYDVAVVRYAPDGTLDTSFNGDGRVVTAIGPGDDYGTGVATQPDDRIVTSGIACGTNCALAVVRYNPDGTLDTAFGGNGKIMVPIGGFVDGGMDVALQNDGKLVVSGFSYNGNDTDVAVVRLNSDGSLDPSFGGNGKVVTDVEQSGDWGTGIAIQVDGKLVVSGYSDGASGIEILVMRYNPDGTLDATFNGDGIAVTPIGIGIAEGLGVTVQVDGKILVSGTTNTEGHTDLAVLRYEPTGILDTTFGTDGKVIVRFGQNDFGQMAAVQQNGKIVVAGSSYAGSVGDFAILRLNPDGTLDQGFGDDGRIVTPVGAGDDNATGLVILADGGILVGGYACSGVCGFAVVRYLGDSLCGNGVTDLLEGCDDGNTLDGDCCSSTCQLESYGSRCAADGEACTADVCDGLGACTHPAGNAGATCRAAAGECDVPEACTGTSAACPVDAYADGIACDDGNKCTQDDMCQGGVCVGADPLDCNDGHACTQDSCNPAIGCVNDDAPYSGCRAAEKSNLVIKHGGSDSSDRLLWKWTKGGALEPSDLGDPIATTSYALCVYEGAARSLIADAALPPGSGWSRSGVTGYRFRGLSPNGLTTAMVRGGGAGRSKAFAKGKGAALPDPALPLTYPVTVQLRREGSPLCLESTFTISDERKNDDTQFKAKQ